MQGSRRMQRSIWNFRIFGRWHPITFSSFALLGGTPLILDTQEFHPLHEIHGRHESQGIGYNKGRELFISPAKIHEALSPPELEIFPSLTNTRTQAKSQGLERTTTITRVRQKQRRYSVGAFVERISWRVMNILESHDYLDCARRVKAMGLSDHTRRVTIILESFTIYLTNLILIFLLTFYFHHSESLDLILGGEFPNLLESPGNRRVVWIK